MATGPSRGMKVNYEERVEKIKKIWMGKKRLTLGEPLI